jgi:hypothetical protein
MKTPGAKVEVVPPWNTVSSVDIQNALDSKIAQTMGRRKSKRKINLYSLPSIREALINVFQDNEELRSKAEETLAGKNPEKVLVPFLSAEPKWVIRCSVTDSMASGIWGLKCFVLGSRGYLYYHPDFGIGDEGECLPVVGIWEPANDRSAGLASLKNAYIAYWENFALPPRMGQWARGPSDFLADAVSAILKQTPSEWPDVLDRLRRDTKKDKTEGGLVHFLAEQVSSQTKVEKSAVSGILVTFTAGRETPVRKLSLSELESQVLVAAFVTRIGMGGF